MKTIILAVLFAGATFPQCGRMAYNSVTGNFDCIGSASSSSGNNTYCADATGGTTTYTCPTPSPTSTTLTGLTVVFVPQTTNTGTSTLNVAGLGAKTLKQADGSTDVGAGALIGGQAYIFQYDGTNFRLPSSGVIAKGTAVLGTSAVSANSCATVVTVGATGVATTDVITWTPNADISGVTGYGAASSDGLIIYPYPTANNVNFKVCNGTGSSITPGAVTLNWRVSR